MTTAIAIDPEFKGLIPPLRDGELALLESSLVHEGCRESLSVWNGTLIDGHNRYAICQREGLVFKTRDIEFADRNAAKLWIIDNQMGRRNITDLDRIGLQRKREDVLKQVGKANQEAQADRGNEGGRGKKKNPSGKIAKRVSHNTRAACAKAAGVGERTYDAGKLILEAEENGELPKQVVDEVRNGKRAIHAVAKEVKEKRQKEARQTKRTEAAKDAKHDDRILVGDFTKLEDKIADGSLSLIFTDPPYDKKASKMLPDLAAFAAAKLADGGSLVMYIGHLQLPAAFQAFEDKLRYWWTCACVHSGGKDLMREYGIRVGWKPMLWFVKGTRDDKSAIVLDTITGATEKDSHDWQQAESEASYWIENLCPKDGIVCDPFLGGGTTAAAAQKLGRRWIGIELDPANAKIASKRIA